MAESKPQAGATAHRNKSNLTASAAGGGRVSYEEFYPYEGYEDAFLAAVQSGKLESLARALRAALVGTSESFFDPNDALHMGAALRGETAHTHTFKTSIVNLKSPSGRIFKVLGAGSAVSPAKQLVIDAQREHARAGRHVLMHSMTVLAAEFLGALEAKGLVKHSEVAMGSSPGEAAVAVDFYPDPLHRGALFMRLTPRGDLEHKAMAIFPGMPEERASAVRVFKTGVGKTSTRPAVEAMAEPAPALSPLSTTEAADILNVSRPYVVKLCDEGVFKGVTHTQGGHRRIPEAEVYRVRESMGSARDSALDQALELSAPAMEYEAIQAVADLASQGKGWVPVAKKSSATVSKPSRAPAKPKATVATAKAKDMVTPKAVPAKKKKSA